MASPFILAKPTKKSAEADQFLNSSLMAAAIPAKALRISMTVMTVARILLSFPISISFPARALQPVSELISLYLLLVESKPSNYSQIPFPC